MQRFIIAASAIAVSLVGCQKDQNSGGNVGEALDKIDNRLAAIEKKLASGAGAARAQRPKRPRPDPKKVYSVPVGDSPFEGASNAKVTIVKAFEFACPYCDRVRPTLKALKQKYGDDLKIVYKQLLVHPQTATTPALASCAAHKQGQHEKMMELIWDKGFKAGRNLSKDNMEKIAGEIGLDMAKFKADMNGAQCKAKLQKEQSEVRKVGASGTPAFFINGRFLSGARPQNFFEELIDEELKKANAAISKGTPLEKYYDEFVVKKGLKKL